MLPSLQNLLLQVLHAETPMTTTIKIGFQDFQGVVFPRTLAQISEDITVNLKCSSAGPQVKCVVTVAMKQSRRI